MTMHQTLQLLSMIALVAQTVSVVVIGNTCAGDGFVSAAATLACLAAINVAQLFG